MLNVLGQTATPVFGAPEGWDAFLLARRRAEFAGPVLHVARDDARMARLVEALAFVAPEAEVLRVARNREATARYAWSPYMHDPKLRERLHRIRVPPLLLWGMADRILSESYGRAYAAALAAARFEPIARAGHFPHIEQAEGFARRIFAFVDET